MNAHRVETVVREDRTVVLEDLPFQAGEAVESLFPSARQNATRKTAIHCAAHR